MTSWCSSPRRVKIQAGGIVKFLAPTRAITWRVSNDDAGGAKPFLGEVNEDIAVTFEKVGFYGYKCKSRYRMGMVGIIVVGEPTNVDQAKVAAHPGKAKQASANLFDRLAAAKTASR